LFSRLPFFGTIHPPPPGGFLVSSKRGDALGCLKRLGARRLVHLREV
jgi:hypothetical protein